MTTSAIEIYEGLVPTESCRVSYQSALISIQDFQTIIADLEMMQSQGLITIMDAHQESQTGYRLIDSIQIIRLK